MADVVVSGSVGTTDVTVTAAAPVEIVIGGSLIGPPGINSIPGPSTPTATAVIQGKQLMTNYNVRDFGAMGDDTTDDTTTIQACIDYVHTNFGGGIVLIPNGTYKITAQLNLHPNMIIQGSGVGSTIIKQYTGNANGIVANDSPFLNITDLTVSNASGSHSAGAGFLLTWTLLGNVQQTHLANAEAIGFNIGVDSQTIITSDIQNVEAEGCDIGFNFFNGGTSTHISNTYANNCTVGYYLSGLVYISFTATACDNAHLAYHLLNCAGISFNGCGNEAGQVSTAPNDGRGYFIDSCIGIGLYNSWSYQNPSYGVYVTNSSAITIVCYNENSPVVGAINGLFIDSNCARITVISPTTQSSNNTQNGTNIVTVLSDNGANAVIPGNVTIGTLTSPTIISGTTGELLLSATPDGGDYNLFVSATGILALYGSAGATLNVALLDGYLEVDTLTATTVPYMDANKRFASSAVTPTQLGYLSAATSASGTGALLFGTSPTVSGLTGSVSNLTAYGNITPGTTGVYLLGSSTEYWVDSYVTRMYLNSTAYFDGTTAGQAWLTGLLGVSGTSGNLSLYAYADGGEYNLGASVSGKLALFGSSAATLDLNLLDGQLYTNSVSRLTNAGVLNNVTLDSAGTGNSLKINGTAITAVSGTGAVVLATSPTLVTPALGTPSAINLTNAAATSLPIAAINATGSASSSTYLRGDGSWATVSGGFTSPMTTLGDIIYENATPAAARLAGNTSATIAVLTQTGTGTVSAAPVWTTTSGTGSVVLATSPTLVTPTLGAATATTINKVTITTPGTSATLTLVTGSSLITSGAFAITLTSTAATNVTLPTTGTLAIVSGALGTPTSVTLTNGTGLPIAGITGLGSGVATLLAAASTGTAALVGSTSPTLVTPILGVATATSINKVTITAPTTSATLTLVTGSSLITTGAFALTLASSASVTITMPATSATMARTDAAQTFTGIQTVALLNSANQAATVATNASTLDINHALQTFTNSSAAAMTITLTTGAADGQFKEVRIYDFSAVAEAITWVNTENSLVTAPTISNGSTTLPLSVLFQYNGSTSKWRCIAAV